MRLTITILGTLVTVAMATPRAGLLDGSLNYPNMLEPRDPACQCEGVCGCPQGTGCECVKGGGGAPCEPYCGCARGSGGQCVVSDLLS